MSECWRRGDGQREQNFDHHLEMSVVRHYDITDRVICAKFLGRVKAQQEYLKIIRVKSYIAFYFYDISLILCQGFLEPRSLDRKHRFSDRL